MSKAIEWMEKTIQSQINNDPQHYSGFEWYQITLEEMPVFQLALEDMPRLIEVYEAYFAIKDIAHNDFYDNKTLCKAVRSDLKIEANRQVHEKEFQYFAKHFGVSNRKAYAFYWKMDFWHIRQGLVTFNDEQQP